MTDPMTPPTPPAEIDPPLQPQPEIDPACAPDEMPPLQPGENDGGAPMPPQHGHGEALT